MQNVSVKLEPTRGTVQLPGWSGWTFTVRFADAASDRAQSVEVTAPAGTSVAPADWRRIPIGRVLSLIANSHSRPMATVQAAALGEPPKRPHAGSDEHRQRVASLYRIAIEQGVQPGELIRGHFGIRDPKTAARYIREARSAGLLGTYQQEVARFGVPVSTRKPTPKESAAALREVPRLITESRARSGRVRSTKPKGGTR